MSKLVSIKEIEELGYKLINGNYTKGKIRYLVCGGCKRFSEVRTQPDENNKIQWKCNWCIYSNITRAK